MADKNADLKEARRRLGNRYGQFLAEKATPEFAMFFGGEKETSPFEARAEGMSEAASQVIRPGTPIVLSCAGPRREDLSAALREGVHGMADRATQGREAGAVAPDAGAMRRYLVQEMRNDFDDRASMVRGGLDAMTQILHEETAGRESAPAMMLGKTQLCWLNSTMRAGSDARVLAEIAGDPLIQRIDLDRRLEREIHETVPLIGAPHYNAEFGVDGTGIIVAVLDGEVDALHEALNPRVIHKQNYTLEAWGNPDVHGTAVAGIAASAHATHRGVAPGATIWSYKIFRTSGLASSFDGALALQDAVTDGAHIANCSWRGPGDTDGTGAEAAAVNTAWALGMVVIKSAGNSGPGASTVTPPADATGVIVVGATSRAGTDIENYSSRGPTDSQLDRPHFVAPGGSTITPGITSCKRGSGSDFHDAGAGTSYAAPHAAGAAALLLQQVPTLSPDDVRARLINACAHIAGGDVNEEGAGLLDLRRLIASPSF